MKTLKLENYTELDEKGEFVEPEETKKEGGSEGKYNEENGEHKSFKDVGEEKWSQAFENASDFGNKIMEGAKGAVFTATGIAFEAPGIVKDAGSAGLEIGKDTYASAKKMFGEAVEKASGKIKQIKDGLVEGAKEAKRSLFERLTKTKDKYVGKAKDLATRGIAWGIDKGSQVKETVTNAYDKINSAVKETRIKRMESENAEHRQKIIENWEKIKELRDELQEKAEKKRDTASNLNPAEAMNATV